MNQCKSCGISIPDGQRICSMCYGDPWYGRDGHALRELEREEMRRQENEQPEEPWGNG